ncbi:unnamed protein product [Echinostoma caproni]|uniref:SEC7 domain-containing protein n=1 Tax=Echinostoma caproni TaxID=27848 RepID=A0A183ASS2_9TREM|nr:unnamed protein product [Echinostoma caproni]
MLGSEQFNSKPKRGIEFLQHYGILRTPLDPTELAHFLRENPRLDKRMIGEYLSDRKNGEVLAAYVRQFNFKGVQIDEALRVYLEAFRLPGEAPLIQRVMEHFAEHWYCANDKPFADVDSAFTLAYAILMLNTDQHNPNSKKQNAPMTASDFKKNLSGMNGTGDFDPKLLDAIYMSINKNEIVMPSEQTGLVRENYLWKCLLRRALTSQADFIHVQTGTLDPDLFDIIWGPTVSALSFIFDKTSDPAVQSKAVDGFIRSAAIAAHHGMSDVLDNLVISLCKFTTLLTIGDVSYSLDVAFLMCSQVSLGRNNKALLALRLVFALTANHADILRYGWHSLLDCLLQLFRASLLPDELVEAEDFVSPSHRVRLTTRGCFSASYWTSIGSIMAAGGQLDDSAATRLAVDTVAQCEIAQLIKDTKFLVDASLVELIKVSIAPSHPTVTNAAPAFSLPTPTASYYPTFFASGGGVMLTEDCRIFCLELLVRVLLHNRDRMTTIWPNVQYYLADLLLTAPEPGPLVERVVVGFLRLATCLLRRHEMTSQVSPIPHVCSSLDIYRINAHISRIHGITHQSRYLHYKLTALHPNINELVDWEITHYLTWSVVVPRPTDRVSKRSVQPHQLVSSDVLALPIWIGLRDAVTLERAADCLAFLVRDPAHITPDNFQVRSQVGNRCTSVPCSSVSKELGEDSNVLMQRSSAHTLLDLIHLLLTRATSIYTEWKYTGCSTGPLCGTDSGTVDANYLWPNCWRPLLQAIARLCCDCRREVRTDALAYLHRVLLIAMEEAAAVANSAKSPKANRSGRASSVQYHAVEYADPRMRAIPLLTKVFLQHLRPLHESENFHVLWTRMLAYMEQYMQASSSDSLVSSTDYSFSILAMYQ